MRKFWLENENGEVLNLNNNSKEPLIFSNPEGIGFEKNTTKIDFTGRTVIYREDYLFNDITGIINCTYKTYNVFIDYIARSGRYIKLFYQYGNERYFWFVNCRSTNKSEITEGVLLKESVIFSKNSLRLSSGETRVSGDVEIGDKIYPYPYPYTYGFSSGEYKFLINDGHYPTPCIIEIFGEAINPTFSIINFEYESRGKFNVRLEKGETLYINSEESELEASIKKLGDQKINVYPYQDWQLDNFLVIPKGVSRIHVFDELGAPLQYEVKFFKQYL
jgi:hypothetical protein